MIQQIHDAVYQRTVHPKNTSWYLNTHLIITDKHNIFIDSGLGKDSITDFLPFTDSGKSNILIVTHHHFDHVWGSGAIEFEHIFAHPLCDSLISQTFAKSVAENGQLAEGSITFRKSDRTMIDDKVIDDRLRCIFAPGHTVDSIMIYDSQSQILFIGDNIGDEGAGLIPELDCPVTEYRATLEKALLCSPLSIASSHRALSGIRLIKDVLKTLTSL